MLVIVRVQNGIHFMLEVEASDSIRDVKMQVQGKDGIDIKDHVLMFANLIESIIRTSLSLASSEFL